MNRMLAAGFAELFYLQFAGIGLFIPFCGIIPVFAVITT
jgi:hypothetical protein